MKNDEMYCFICTSYVYNEDFAEIVNAFKAANYFRKKLYHRCLIKP